MVSVLALVQLFGAVLAIGLAAYAYRRRDQPGIVWLVVVLIGDTIWMLAAGLNYAISSFSLSAALLQLRYLGIPLVPVAIFFFALSYTGYDERLTRGHRVLIALPAAAALLLALTDGVHGLFYASITPASNPQQVAYEYGLAAFPWIIYAFLLTVGAVAAFARYALFSDTIYRWQAVGLAGAVSIGIVADLLFFLPVPPTGFAITPLSILLSCAIAIAIVLRHDFVRLIPATRELGRKELIERMELGMLVVNADGRVVDVNPAAARILDRSPDELLGEPVPDGLPDPDGETVVEQTFTIDGIDRDVEIRTNRVGGGSGIWLLTLQERDDLTDVVSHDLQGPLMEIRGSADLAITTGEITHVDRVLTAANRIDELVADLLQLAQTGRQLETREPVDLTSISTAAWNHVWSPNAELTVESSRTVVGDPDRIQQLLENLFRNSVEHGTSTTDSQSSTRLGLSVPREADRAADDTAWVPPGGDSNRPEGTRPLSLERSADEDVVQITVGTLADGFYVEDTGPGIPEENRERIFEKGYTDSPSGTGFGLSIVRQVASAHGWSIRATEGTTGGARFEITDVEFADSLDDK